jgi:hypothetical protein
VVVTGLEQKVCNGQKVVELGHLAFSSYEGESKPDLKEDCLSQEEKDSNLFFEQFQAANGEKIREKAHLSRHISVNNTLLLLV